MKKSLLLILLLIAVTVGVVLANRVAEDETIQKIDRQETALTSNVRQDVSSWD